MDAARMFLATLGLIFAAAGLFVGWMVDRLFGLALLVVGAFLLMLPLITYHPDD